MIHGIVTRARTATLFLVIVLAGVAPGLAVDFIRGDVNGDGKVSISDVHALGKGMGQGTLGCLDAADASDDGEIFYTDGERIMGIVFGQLALPDPWGAPGPDPTPDGEVTLGCDAYGGGLPYSDPSARVIVRDAVAEGGSRQYAVITIALTHSTSIGGYQCLLRDPSGVVASYRIGDSYEGEDRYNDNYGPARDLTGTYADKPSTWSYARVTGGKMWIGYGGRAWGSITLAPRSDADVIEFTICLKPGTRAGTYPLVLESAELVHASTSRPIEPALASANLTVLEDLDAGLGCPDREEPSPDNIEATLEIGDGSATPGGTFSLPLTVEASEFVAGYILSIDFDEEVLLGVDVAQTFLRPDGYEYDTHAFDIQNRNDTPGSGGTDEGYIFAYAIFEFESLAQVIPPSTRTEVLRLDFQARPEARVGATQVSFLDGAISRAGRPVANSLFSGGELVDPESRDSFVFINGRINVLPDGAAFVRGDSNDDAALDVSDAVHTLGWLFLGDEIPACLDAADSNDDGRIDIADPAATLNFLFEGGGSLPPPSAVGGDPTPDLLGCRG